MLLLLTKDPVLPTKPSNAGYVETYTIECLTNDQVYEVQVVAFNGLGRGYWSETVRGTPVQMLSSPPQEQVLEAQ